MTPIRRELETCAAATADDHVVLAVSVLQSFSNAVCVTVDGDRERAAWLRFGTFEMLERDASGAATIRLRRELAAVRGLL